MALLPCHACHAPVSVVGGVPAKHECGRAKAGAKAEAPKLAPKVRRGALSEAAMLAALQAAGYYDTTFTERPDSIDPRLCFRRQHPWGLKIGRGHAGDFAFLAAGILCEVTGTAHSRGAGALRSDLERERLAMQAGERVVRIDPEWIATGEAVALVRAALKAEPGRDSEPR